MAQLTKQAMRAREYISDSLKNTHTPGPWYTRHGQVSSMTSTHGCTIANCNSTSKGISDAEIEANSALIAASPELLEACILAERAMGGEAMEFDSPERALFTAKQALRKAIAQARGEE